MKTSGAQLFSQIECLNQFGRMLFGTDILCLLELPHQQGFPFLLTYKIPSLGNLQQ